MLGQLLAYPDVGQVAQAGPAVLLGKGDAHHAHLRQLVPGLLRKPLLLVDLSCDGRYLLQAEIVQHVQDLLLFFVKVEIHTVAPFFLT